MEEIENLVCEFIAERNTSESDFNDLACKIAKYQYETVSEYKRFVDFSGENPDDWYTWRDIVPMPVVAYKQHFYDAITGAGGWNEGESKLFSSSGTTGKKSVTVLGNAKTYDYSTKYGFETFLSDVPRKMLSLIPSREQWPNSSLSYMFSEGFKGLDITEGYVMDDERFNLDFEVISDVFHEDEPVTIYGTSYAIDELADVMQYRLPEGSKIIDTGGFKGLRKEKSRSEMAASLTSAFGLRASDLINEYGMSELLSPSWQRGLGGHYFPDWVRVRKQQGSLVVVDLAQIWTVCALHTQDRVRLLDDKSIAVEGRMKGTDPKGCSLAAKEAMS